jgi:DNA-binding transcriptional LysR family regulator
MDLFALRTFVEVVRRGSFATVARDRNTAPSSVSRTIAAMEGELGFRLFQRTTRRLAPTEAGAVYFRRIEPLIGELEQAEQLAHDAAAEPRGTLRVTAPVSFAQANLVPLLPEFTRRYPEVSFDLVLNETFMDLVDDRIDVALRLGRLAASGLVAHRLSDMRYVVCASPDYLRRNGRPAKPQDLEHHHCLRYPIPGYGAVWRFRNARGRISEVPVRGRVIASSGGALRQCAVAGMGLVMLPRWNLAAELRDGSLVQLFPEHAATASEFDVAAWLLYPSRAYLPLKVRVFVDFIKEQFRAGPPAERVGPAGARTP